MISPLSLAFAVYRLAPGPDTTLEWRQGGRGTAPRPDPCLLLTGGPHVPPRGTLAARARRPVGRPPRRRRRQEGEGPARPDEAVPSGRHQQGRQAVPRR